MNIFYYILNDFLNSLGFKNLFNAILLRSFSTHCLKEYFKSEENVQKFQLIRIIPIFTNFILNIVKTLHTFPVY